MVSVFTHKLKNARNDTEVTILLFSLLKAETRAKAKEQILDEYQTESVLAYHPNKAIITSKLTVKTGTIFISRIA